MLKKLKSKLSKNIKYLYAILFLTLSNLKTVYAGDIQNSKPITGTQKLFQDASVALTVLALPVGGFFIAWNFFKLKSAEDESEERGIRKKIKTVVIATIGVFVGSGLLAIVLNYYK